MPRVLLAWIGNTDLRASKGEEVGVGPIAQGIDFRDFDEAIFLSNYEEEIGISFKTWLQARTKAAISIKQVKLKGPTNFEEIYPAAKLTVDQTVEEYGKDVDLSFHISPGTPAMAAVWIILATTRFTAELLESSKDHGVRVVSFPFEISADFVPSLYRKSDRDLERRSLALPPKAPEFDTILHRSPAMKRVIAVAQRAAFRNVRVLIEGETGTGKELFARAIHEASPRKGKPCITVNCGAIPSELVESELFGHEKGAFTGADRTRRGKFEEANGGTIFLDEIGELPLQVQVKILRVLQQNKITRVGSSEEIAIDVRVIAATNRTLIKEVAAGRFREDLYYRLAVVILRLPPLRDREGDPGLLIDFFMEQINRETKNDPGFEHKTLSPGARNLLLKHSWPGNVRELENTLHRLVVWSEGPRIEKEDVEASIESLESREKDILHRSLGGHFRLPELLDEVARHYLTRAMKEANGEMTKATKLVGLPSYQTLSNWLKKYGLEDLKRAD